MPLNTPHSVSENSLDFWSQSSILHDTDHPQLHSLGNSIYARALFARQNFSYYKIEKMRFHPCRISVTVNKKKAKITQRYILHINCYNHISINSIFYYGFKSIRLSAGFTHLTPSVRLALIFSYSSVQFSRSVVSNSLRLHASQHTRPPCPSPTPGVHPNSCASSW